MPMAWRIWTLTLVLGWGWMLPGAAGAEGIPAPAQSPEPDLWTLEAAREAVLQRNPDLQAALARLQALQEIPSQVATLPDPWVSLGLLNLPLTDPSLTQDPMTQLQVGVSQRLPYPGKLTLRGEVARVEAEAGAQDVAELRLRLQKEVSILWWELFYHDRALDTVRQNQDLMREFVRVAEAKYATGRGLQQDVLLAQTELSHLLDTEIRLQGMRRRLAAAFNALLNRPLRSPVRLPQEVPAVSRPLARLPDLDTLEQQALKHRPLLQGQSWRVQAATLRTRLARLDYFPDFQVRLSYGFRAGTFPDGRERPDFATVLFQLNLPIHTRSRQDRALAQRRAEQTREQHRFEALRAQVRRELEQAVVDYERAREQVLLYRQGIVPQAEQTVSSMLAGYQVGKVDFLNLVRAQITLLNDQLQAWRYRIEAHQALARLEAAVGEEILP